MRKNTRQRSLAILLVLLIGMLWTQCQCQESPSTLPQHTDPTPPNTPTPPIEISDAMINYAKSAFPFLADVLAKLQRGEAGAINDLDATSGQSALHYAAELGHLDIVNALIDRGADKEAQDSNGSIPLHLAASEGCKEVVELLIDKGADKEAKDSDGSTPLHWAALRRHKEVVEFLIDKGADKEVKDKDSCTLLPPEDVKKL